MAPPVPQRRTLRDRLAWLFPESGEPSPLPAERRIALAAAAVAAGALASLGRIRGPGPFNTVFAEDASNFLTDALHKGPLQAVFTPFNGYFHIGPRLLTEVAALAPLRWQPAVLSVLAALVLGLLALACYVASAAHVRPVVARLLVSVPVVVCPVAENIAATTTNNVATLQFFALYAVFWMLLWVPASRAGRIVAAVAIGLTAVSTLLTVLFLPLALVRLYVRRRRPDLVLTVLLTAGAALHATALAVGLTARPWYLKPSWDPAWAVDVYVRWGLPHSVFGYRWSGVPLLATSHRQMVLAELAWLVVLAALGYALLRRRSAGPAWGLAGVAAVHSVGLLMFQFMASSRAEERYAIAPSLLLVVVMVALLRPTSTVRGRVAFAAYAALVAVVIAVNYVGVDSGRTRDKPWDQRLREATAVCRQDPALVTVKVTAGGGGAVIVPCAKLR